MTYHADFSHTSAGDVKFKITQIVNSYQEVFIVEYNQFLVAQKPKTESIQKENKFAIIKGADVIERQLGEMPETLAVLLQRNLTTEEYIWLQSKPGANWFYKTFSQYRVTSSI